MTSRTELPAIDAQWAKLYALNAELLEKCRALQAENHQLNMRIIELTSKLPAITDAQSAISKWRVTPWDL